MLKLTEEQIRRIEEMLDGNSYSLDFYINDLIQEGAFEKAYNKKPDIVDALGCIFTGNSRYRKHWNSTYFSIENSKDGTDFSIIVQNCDGISKELFEEIKNITMAALSSIEESYVKKE